MDTITIGKNDAMVYSYQYAPEGVAPIKLKQRTFSEAYQEYIMVSNAYRDAERAYKEAYDHMRKMCAEVRGRGDGLFDKDELVKADAQCKMSSNLKKLWAIGLKGAEGMLEYYTALEVNKAMMTVLSTFKGKKAGPKTSQHFWEGVGECMPIPGISVYHRRYHAMSVVMPNNHSVDLWFFDDLTDTDNRFVERVTVCVPSNPIEGKFPTDWYTYAQHITAANEFLNEKFNDFLAIQNSLKNSLKIGEVPMAHVNPTAQREES